MSVFTRIILCAMLAAACPQGRAQTDLAGNRTGMDDTEDEQIANAAALDVAEAIARPVDLLHASEETIAALPGVTAIEAHRIVAMRDSIGVDALARAAQRPMMPIAAFVRLRPVQYALALRSRVTYQLESPLGIIDGTYLGPRAGLYQRCDVRWHEWDARIIMEKGAGEITSTDHVIGSVGCSDIVPGLTAIAGDYDLGLAQGLIFWRTLAPGKGSDVVRAPRRAAFGVSAARSPYDRASFRGGACAWNDSIWSVALFASNARRDASLGADGAFTSVAVDSRYQTLADLAKRDAIGEQMQGAHVAVRALGVALGATAAFTTLDHPWRHAGAMHSHLSQVGVDWQATSARWNMYGECAMDGARDVAAIAGVTGRLSDALDLAACVRVYPPQYVALHVNAFGEHSSAENERGVYAAIRWHINDRATLAMFHDLFAYPAPTNSIPIPSSGSESWITLESKLATHVTLRATCSVKSAPASTDTVLVGGRTEPYTTDAWRGRAQSDIRYSNHGLRFGARVGYVVSRATPGATPSAGMLLMVDAAIDPLPGVRAGGRIAWFATQSYDGRVYASEDAPEGTASVPALSGAGQRSYLFLSFDLFEACHVECKWSTTYLPRVASIGTGEDATPGDSRHTVEVQVRWRFEE